MTNRIDSKLPQYSRGRVGRYMRQFITVLLLSLCITQSSSAQEKKPLPPETMDQLRVQDEAIRKLEKLEVQLEDFGREFLYRCMRALGHTAFCVCIRDNGPATLGFQQFIAVASQTKAEVKFDSLSKDDKSIYLKVMEARNGCVTKHKFN